MSIYIFSDHMSGVAKVEHGVIIVWRCTFDCSHWRHVSAHLRTSIGMLIPGHTYIAVRRHWVARILRCDIAWRESNMVGDCLQGRDECSADCNWVTCESSWCALTMAGKLITGVCYWEEHWPPILDSASTTVLFAPWTCLISVEN